jgi:hypothetical protein
MLAASPDAQAQVLEVLDRMNALMAVGDLVGQRAQFADDADVATIGSADFEVYLDADSDFTYTFDGTEQTLPYRLTVVCQRRDGRWRIVLFHGSEPADLS